MYFVLQSEKDFPDISVMVFYRKVCYNEVWLIREDLKNDMDQRKEANRWKIDMI